MNVNFEAIEKAWFKPKKTILDELEEFVIDRKNYSEDLGFECCAEEHQETLNKIQELKKENENGKVF